MTEVHQLIPNDWKSYEVVYKTYFKGLVSYAYTLLNNDVHAEEMVQNVFLKLWEKKETIDIHTSLQAYLYKSVYFESLNFIKHQNVKKKHEPQIAYAMNQHHAPGGTEKLQHKNLEEKFRSALNDLPEQCRTVFQLSRFEDLKYREIAAKLGISEKTVENHMGKALKVLRLKLVDFITMIIFTIVYLKNNWL